MNVKMLPTDITSYDLFKFFAVMTMIVDHFGIYFFPDDLWYRVIGRLSFPVWLFLVGYARSREIPPILIGGAVIVFLSNIVAGMGLLPLSILVSIMIVRLCLDPIMKQLSKSSTHLWVGSGVLFVVALPSFILFEFGALAFIFAIFGYLVRQHGPSIETFRYAVFVCLGYVFLQSLGYAIFDLQLVVMAIGMVGVTAALYNFKPQTYPEITKDMSCVGRRILHLCGRHTLEIYVGHLLLFKAVAVLIGVEGYEFMNWGWVW